MSDEFYLDRNARLRRRTSIKKKIINFFLNVAKSGVHAVLDGMKFMFHQFLKLLLAIILDPILVFFFVMLSTYKLTTHSLEVATITAVISFILSKLKKI